MMFMCHPDNLRSLMYLSSEEACFPLLRPPAIFVHNGTSLSASPYSRSLRISSLISIHCGTVALFIHPVFRDV